MSEIVVQSNFLVAFLCSQVVIGLSQIPSFFSWISSVSWLSVMAVSGALQLVLELRDLERRVICPFSLFQGFVKFHTSRFLSDWQWSRYTWTNVSCNMIGQWFLKGQSNDTIHNRYVKTKTTQERLLRRTLHTWSSSFYIHRRKLEKDRSWLKRERNFAQKNECALVAQVHSDLCAIFFK